MMKRLNTIYLVICDFDFGDFFLRMYDEKMIDKKMQKHVKRLMGL